MKVLLLVLSLAFTSEEIEFNETIVEASFYADKFEGRRTANGEVYSHSRLTAASNVFDLGDTVTVCNLEDVCIDVVINDRIAPRFRHRIDLTPRAFKMLGNIRRGIIKVRVKIKD